jgi:hypothetical protein
MFKRNGDLVTESGRDIPVYANVDVVVAGSGPGGFVPLTARNRKHCWSSVMAPGWTGTASLQVWFGGQNLYGIGKTGAKDGCCRVARYMERGRHKPVATGVSPMLYHLSFDPETWKYMSMDMVREAGGKVLTHTLAVDAIVENNVAKGIIIESKSGRQAVLAKVVIDATGDADLAFRAGCTMDKMNNSGYHLGMPMLFRVGGVNYAKIAEYARQHPEDMNAHTGVPPGDFDGINYALVCGFRLEFELPGKMAYYPKIGGALGEKKASAFVEYLLMP